MSSTMSEWTSIHDILQDLSVAQGFTVPASLETFGNNRPPALNIDEESEEQTYYESGGGGDFESPDYNLIQEMLNMVRETKDNTGDDDLSLESDLNPLSPEFVPQVVKKKINRNVALSSIINAKETELASKRPISNNVIPTMFKRKSLNHTGADVRSQSVSPLKISSPEKDHQYTPSRVANEYYSKYLEKSRLKEQFEGDIWKRAEQRMKEIDAKKRRKAEFLNCQENGFNIVSLPEHRHLLTKKCTVCEVIAKRGYYFKEIS